MLGAGRASQYAGWWQSNPPAVVNMTSVSSASYLTKVTPSYSYLMEVNSSESQVGYNLGYQYDNQQYFNLTGLTGFTGYNNDRLTMVSHVYLPWSSQTSASTNGQMRINLKQSAISSSDFSWTIYCGQNGGTGKFYVDASSPNGGVIFETTDSYSNYNDKWLTVVFCQAETSSVYTNWTGTGTGGVYLRVALYNTQTGALIGKKDAIVSAPSPNYDLSALPTNLTTSPDNNDRIQIQGYPGGTYANDYDYRVQSIWFSMGTMFDPLSATDTSWLTPQPSKQIGNAVAWLNSEFNEYTYRFDYDTTGVQGVKRAGGNIDLFVQNTTNGGNVDVLFQSANANVFLTQYSNSIVILNGGT